MAIAVPHRQRNAPPHIPVPPPIDPAYEMMAAAQMHSEGRLFQPPTGGVGDKLATVPGPDQSPIRV